MAAPARVLIEEYRLMSPLPPGEGVRLWPGKATLESAEAKMRDGPRVGLAQP